MPGQRGLTIGEYARCPKEALGLDNLELAAVMPGRMGEAHAAA